MIKCVNKECDNYNHELEESVEVCPLCKNPTENVVTKTDGRKRLGAIITIASFASLIAAMLPSMIMFYVGIGCMLACIVVAIIVRQKMAIIASIIAAAAMFGLLLYFGYFEMLF